MGDAAGTRSGQPVAVFRAVGDAAAIVGPLAAGALDDAYPFPAAVGLAVVLMLTTSLFALRMSGTDTQAWASVLKSPARSSASPHHCSCRRTTRRRWQGRAVGRPAAPETWTRSRSGTRSSWRADGSDEREPVRVADPPQEPEAVHPAALVQPVGVSVQVSVAPGPSARKR